MIEAILPTEWVRRRVKLVAATRRQNKRTHMCLHMHPISGRSFLTSELAADDQLQVDERAITCVANSKR